MNKLCVSGEQFVGNPAQRPKLDIYPHPPTAASQAFPHSDRMQSAVAQPFLELYRVPGDLISCYYSLKI
jgi:hypothetical protein